MICNPFYDESVMECIDEYIETNIKGKNHTEVIKQCISDLLEYNYTENDMKIVDMNNFQRYMLGKYPIEMVFKSMNGKQAADAISYFEDVEFIAEMLSNSITLEEMLGFYYIAYLHYNKRKIVKRLLEWLEFTSSNP
jgi:hypothetical protein